MAEFTTKFTIDLSKSSLYTNLIGMGPKFLALVKMYASTKSKELESYMKTNRPWTDRTNMAKTTLNATMSTPSAEVIRITLAHGVDYGIWLELAHGKNYAIVEPTVRLQGPKMVQELNGIIERISV